MMIKVGEKYAYRKRRKMGEPLEQILVVKEGPPKSNQVRIRHLEGEYVDFEEWVPKSQLILPWEEACAFCEDERRLLILLQVMLSKIPLITMPQKMYLGLLASYLMEISSALVGKQ